jgi:hypothetical protein
VTAPARRFPVTALAACLLGLAVSPIAFIAVGAVGQAPPLFRATFLPAFALGCGFLLWRYLSRPQEGPVWPTTSLLVAEGLAWIAVLAFLYWTSQVNLLRGFERVGAACTAFLVASVLCLPIVLLRRTALERRLSGLPGGLALTLLLVMLAAASAVMAVYLRSPPEFI